MFFAIINMCSLVDFWARETAFCFWKWRKVYTNLFLLKSCIYLGGSDIALSYLEKFIAYRQVGL